VNPQLRSAIFGLLLCAPVVHLGAAIHRPKPQANEAQVELTRLLQQANQARDAGDPKQVIEANQPLAATTLRLLGQLQLQAGKYAQAADLYQSALPYADTADARTDLAIALWMNQQMDPAIQQASKALADDPKNLRAAIVLGRVSMEKQQYGPAAAAFAQAAALDPGDIELPYSEAIALLSLQKPEDQQKAVAVFQGMQQMAGDSGSLHVLFGRAYRDAGYMPDAIREFERAIALGPATPHAHYFLGLARLSSNEWKPTPAAQKEFLAELRYHPRDYLANYMLGYMASMQHAYAEASRYLHAAIAVNPNWPEPWLYLGLDDYSQGKMQTAERMLRKAVETTGSDVSRNNYQIRRAYIDLGRILAQSGQQQQAQSYFAQARALQNDILAQSQQQIADMAQRSGKTMAAAVAPLSAQQENQAAPELQAKAGAASQVYPSEFARTEMTPAKLQEVQAQENNLHLILAQCLSDMATAEAIQGEYTEALQNYQAAAKWNPTIPDLAKNLGLCAYKAKNYPVAAEWLTRALQQDPTAGNALHAMLGMADYAMHQYAQAVRAWIPLGDLGMQDSAVGYAWADALIQLGDTQEAADVLTLFQGSNTSNASLLEIGRLWIAIGDYGKAVAAFHQILGNDPRYPKAHFDAGEADMRWEHWEDAAREFQAELALTPADPDAQYDLGYVDLHLSRNADAQALFEKVLAGNPDYGNAQYELGKMLLEQGDLQNSVVHLEKAAQLLPDKDYVHYQLQVAYRKLGRSADASREVQIYSALKTKARQHVASGMGAVQEESMGAGQR
jgi:tetratricopeptide (TPR) repeat protein